MYIQGPRHCAPARPAYLGEKPSIQTFSITDIYVPRVRPLGEWFHVSSVLWEFERYRPILMIDANGDYQQGKDKGLQSFLDKSHLVDPYADRFGHTRTYLHGKLRLDYIFMDPALVQSITAIGYLGTHEGANSDHIMAYVDMDQRSLFAGLINRPPPLRS